jgi:ATP-dependent helicase/nuclease subunit A
VHQLLEQWDFQLDPENFRAPLRAFFCKAFRDECDHHSTNAIVLDIERIMETFLQSPAYQELQQATVFGREVPFVMPWLHTGQDDSVARSCVMEGVMDVVYEVAGEIWVGDYKTDRVTASTLGGYADMYCQQAQIYAAAAAASLGLDIKGCKLIFLRIGEAVSIMRDVAKL